MHLVFRSFGDRFKIESFIDTQQVVDGTLLLFNSVRVLNNGVLNFFCTVLITLVQFIKYRHQLIQADLGKFLTRYGHFFNLLQVVSNIATLFTGKTLLLHWSQLLTYFFELFVFDQFAYQLSFRIVFGTFLCFVTRQQHFGFDAHQCSSHKNKLAGQLHIQTVHLVDIVQKVIGDACNRDILYVQFIALDEKQQQVEGPFKLG